VQGRDLCTFQATSHEFTVSACSSAHSRCWPSTTVEGKERERENVIVKWCDVATGASVTWCPVKHVQLLCATLLTTAVPVLCVAQ